MKMSGYHQNLAEARKSRLERQRQTKVVASTIVYALIGVLAFAALVSVAGHAIDHVLDAKGITAQAQNTPRAEATNLGTMQGDRLQGSEPDLQPADRVQPQQATGGVGSY